MDINASMIKRERHARSWTQQHLADVCNLSLRTIQRVERFGSAAPDTVMELCAVLELEQAVLLVSSEKEAKLAHKFTPVLVGILIVLALVFGGVLGALLTYFSMNALT